MYECPSLYKMSNLTSLSLVSSDSVWASQFPRFSLVVPRIGRPWWTDIPERGASTLNRLGGGELWKCRKHDLLTFVQGGIWKHLHPHRVFGLLVLENDFGSGHGISHLLSVCLASRHRRIPLPKVDSNRIRNVGIFRLIFRNVLITTGSRYLGSANGPDGVSVGHAGDITPHVTCYSGLWRRYIAESIIRLDDFRWLIWAAWKIFVRTKTLKRIEGCSRYAEDRPPGWLGLRETGVRKGRVRLWRRSVWVINERCDKRFRHVTFLFYGLKLGRMVKVISKICLYLFKMSCWGYRRRWGAVYMSALSLLSEAPGSKSYFRRRLTWPR